MSLYGIGDQVWLRNAAGERSFGFVTSVDEEAGRFFITKFNAHRSNYAAASTVIIPKALRIDDGSPIQPNEDFVIEGASSRPADFLETMNKASKRVLDMTSMIGEVRESHQKKCLADANLFKALIVTLSNFTDNQDLKEALLQVLRTGAEVKAPSVPEPNPRKNKSQTNATVPVGSNPSA